MLDVFPSVKRQQERNEYLEKELAKEMAAHDAAMRTVLELRKYISEGNAQRILDAQAGTNQPDLTSAQIERLAWLIEECGEVAQAACKVLRHGYWSSSPFGGAVNRVGLEREMGDLRAAMQFLETAQDVNRADVAHWMRRKAISVHKWLHHQEPVNKIS